MKLLLIVEKNNEENLMDASNLSIVFGVNVLVSKESKNIKDPITLFQESQKIISAFSNFFKFWSDLEPIFDDVKM